MEKSPRPAQMESAIKELIQDLQEMTVTPHVRELRAKAVTYGRVIASWATYAPTTPQLQAMLECVTELEEKVALAKRGEVSHVSRKPTAGREPGLSSIPPDGVAWNANVNAGSARPRSKVSERATTPPPPPRLTTVPPVSANRSIDTPTPALLRSRRLR